MCHLACKVVPPSKSCLLQLCPGDSLHQFNKSQAKLALVKNEQSQRLLKRWGQWKEGPAWSELVSWNKRLEFERLTGFEKAPGAGMGLVHVTGPPGFVHWRFYGGETNFYPYGRRRWWHMKQGTHGISPHPPRMFPFQRELLEETVLGGSLTSQRTEGGLSIASFLKEQRVNSGGGSFLRQTF